MITRRSKDVIISIRIPLPKRFWRKRVTTDAARANMSAAQRRRHVITSSQEGSP